VSRGKQLAKSFYEYEFRCRCGCGLVRIHPGMLELLQRVRDDVHLLTGIGMTITSGCRCKAHNDRVGGAPRSFHISDFCQWGDQEGALAVDVALPQGGAGLYRGTLVHAAWDRGFSIGWGKGFIHLDGRAAIGIQQTSFDY
jgi:hypothetical protein